MTAARTGLRVVSSLDEGRWRRFLDAADGSNVFHTPEMYRVFEATARHRPRLWAVADGDGEVTALFTPVEVSVLGGPSSYLTTRSVGYGGFATVEGDVGDEALDLLLTTYGREVGRRPVFTESRNQIETAGRQRLLERHGWVHEEHLNILIDLTRSDDELWGAIKSSARRNIRNARKSGVEVDVVGSPDDLPAVYDVLRTTYRRLQVPLPPSHFFAAALDHLGKAGLLHVLRARVPDGSVAGVLCLLVSGGVATYWYTGALREHSRLRASDLLVWRAIEIAKEQGAATFDFGGAGKPGEEYGVRDFKLKFGGELVNPGRDIAVHAASRKRLSERGFELVRRFV